MATSWCIFSSLHTGNCSLGVSYMSGSSDEPAVFQNWHRAQSSYSAHDGREWWYPAILNSQLTLNIMPAATWCRPGALLLAGPVLLKTNSSTNGGTRAPAMSTILTPGAYAKVPSVC